MAECLNLPLVSYEAVLQAEDQLKDKKVYKALVSVNIYRVLGS